MSDEGDCRTAPAPPGLLKRHSQNCFEYTMSGKYPDVSGLHQHYTEQHAHVYTLLAALSSSRPAPVCLLVSRTKFVKNILSKAKERQSIIHIDSSDNWLVTVQF